MIRHLIRRHGFLAVTVGMTVSSVLFAILLLVVLDLILKGSVPLVDLVIVVIIPGVIAPVMTSSFIRLVHQLDQAEEKLKILAREDPLTKTFNRRHFMELAEAEWERASRYGAPLSLLLLDVDHFKRINDRHGHAVGDQLLVGMADALQASLRKPDVLARFGGEEFVVLLPETPREGLAGCRAAAGGHPSGKRQPRSRRRDCQHRRKPCRLRRARPGSAAGPGGSGAVCCQTDWPEQGGASCSLNRSDPRVTFSDTLEPHDRVALGDALMTQPRV